MKRSEILIVLGLITFGLLYQMIDSGRSSAGNRVTSHFEALKSGPGHRIEKPLICQSGFRQVFIGNSAGDITFRNNETGALEVMPTIECYKVSRKEALKMAQQVEIQYQTDKNGTITLQPVIPDRYNYRRMRVRLDVRLPRGIPLKVHARYGVVELDHLDNPSQLYISRCDLEAKGLTSSLDVQHSHGFITLTEIEDILNINTSFSQLEASQCLGIGVTGNHTRIYLKDIRGDVFIANRHEKIELHDIKGNVNVQASDSPVFLSGIEAATLSLKNSYKLIKGMGISASTLDAMVSNGKLDLQLNRLTDTLSIKARQSDLKLGLPAGIKPLLQVQLKYGRFSNQSYINVDLESGRTIQRASSFGDKPVIVVEGRYSDMVLSQTSTDPPRP